ncbi:aldehyde-activating protein [Pseudovibrio sp. SCP19]|uniref:GFA family protein n=1 Tax=Pseudovibrio sp. SCP19 TaxID=3141374 RepID=UPI003339871D
MHEISHGQCSCGGTHVQLKLQKPLSEYAPRRCSCDYCTQHDGIYLSHPKGELLIEASQPLTEEKQGSRQATILFCPACNDMIAVTCQINDQLKGAVRAPLLKDYPVLPPAQPVSPASLSPEERLNRWDQVWMSVDLKVVQ